MENSTILADALLKVDEGVKIDLRLTTILYVLKMDRKHSQHCAEVGKPIRQLRLLSASAFS